MNPEVKTKIIFIRYCTSVILSVTIQNLLVVPLSCEATKAVAKIAQKKFGGFIGICTTKLAK